MAVAEPIAGDAKLVISLLAPAAAFPAICVVWFPTVVNNVGTVVYVDVFTSLSHEAITGVVPSTNVVEAIYFPYLREPGAVLPETIQPAIPIPAIPWLLTILQELTNVSTI